MNNSNTYYVSDQIDYEYIWDVYGAQDGAIYGGYLFRFDPRGGCKVFSMAEKRKISEFTLDQIELLMPHSNAVCFGSRFYEEADEFPLLYSNIYNNYAKAEDRKEGVCCVYRLTRDGSVFSTKLVQVIKIGFTEQLDYWKSLADRGDVRPYGNFVVDTDNDQLAAFVMRDDEMRTRYFVFDLPEAQDGEYCELCQAKVVTLNIEDIKQQFDCEYTNYMQGACYHDNKIFSVEGFDGPEVPARLRVIDLVKEKQVASVDLYGLGMDLEPEFIEFYQGVLYYSDGAGKLYTIKFK